MVTPLHETLKTKFFDETKGQLSALASLNLECNTVRSRLSSSPDFDPHTTSTDLATRAAALEETVQIIQELEDLSHSTIELRVSKLQKRQDAEGFLQCHL